MKNYFPGCYCSNMGNMLIWKNSQAGLRNKQAGPFMESGPKIIFAPLSFISSETGHVYPSNRSAMLSHRGSARYIAAARPIFPADSVGYRHQATLLLTLHYAEALGYPAAIEAGRQAVAVDDSLLRLRKRG